MAAAMQRIERYYRPYHAILAQLIAETKRRFGACTLVDCHSMPSVGGPLERDAGRERVDRVLGDCRGTSCAALLTDRVEMALSQMGYQEWELACVAASQAVKTTTFDFSGVKLTTWSALSKVVQAWS